eukprot:g75169.t1
MTHSSYLRQTRVMVVEARRKEIQGLYDARCLEWATWQDAERDRVKPIRTGFVDAIKEDEATGEKKYKSRLVIYGNQMIPFQHFSPYETSSPVAQHIFLLTLCSLLVALNAFIKHIDFSQAYSHARETEHDLEGSKGTVRLSTGRKTMGDDGTFPSSIAYDDRKNNTKTFLRRNWNTTPTAINGVRGQPRFDTYDYKWIR